MKIKQIATQKRFQITMKNGANVIFVYDGGDNFSLKNMKGPKDSKIPKNLKFRHSNQNKKQEQEQQKVKITANDGKLICQGKNLAEAIKNSPKDDSGKIKLINANLSFLNLRDLDLSYANLSFANLSGADLRGSKLTKADLYNANLTDAILINVDLRRATILCTKLQGAKINKNTLFSQNINPKLFGVIFIGDNQK